MVAGMAKAGQCHDEPLHEEDRRTPSPGHCGRDLTYGDHPLQMEDGFDGHDATHGRLDDFWSMW